MLVSDWDVSGSCTSPVLRTVKGTRVTDSSGRQSVQHYVDMTVRCRKCPRCRKAHAAHWRMRAQAELRVATRTWFGTLTLRPDEHYRALLRALKRANERQSDFELRSEAEKFAMRVSASSPDIRDFMKRVRFESGARLRFILVAEAHKSGLPHFHMLLHEWGKPVPKSLLERQWRLGFSSWRLVDNSPRAAGYVTKYLSKDVLARVRASLRYGDPPVPALGHSDLDKVSACCMTPWNQTCSGEGTVQNGDDQRIPGGLSDKLGAGSEGPGFQGDPERSHWDTDAIKLKRSVPERPAGWQGIWPPPTNGSATRSRPLAEEYASDPPFVP